MTIASKRKQKIVARLPVEAAYLSRYDYAVSIGKAAPVDRTDGQAAGAASQAAAIARRKAVRGGAILEPDCLVIAEPLQVTVVMPPAYAAQLLKQLRGAKKPRRGDTHLISFDCPVEIVVAPAMLEEMINKLEGKIGGETKKALRPKQRATADAVFRKEETV